MDYFGSTYSNVERVSVFQQTPSRNMGTFRLPLQLNIYKGKIYIDNNRVGRYNKVSRINIIYKLYSIHLIELYNQCNKSMQSIKNAINNAINQ